MNLTLATGPNVPTDALDICGESLPGVKLPERCARFADSWQDLINNTRQFHAAEFDFAAEPQVIALVTGRPKDLLDMAVASFEINLLRARALLRFLSHHETTEFESQADQRAQFIFRNYDCPHDGSFDWHKVPNDQAATVLRMANQLAGLLEKRELNQEIPSAFSLNS